MPNHRLQVITAVQAKLLLMASLCIALATGMPVFGQGAFEVRRKAGHIASGDASLLASQGFAKLGKAILAAVEAAPELASLSLHVVDKGGTKATPAFTIYDAQDKKISEHTENDRWARVPPGTYLLEPAFDPLLGQQVTVGPGETVDVAVVVANAIWLKFAQGQGQPPKPLLLRLKPPEQMRQVLGRVRLTNHYRRQIGMLRPGVSRDQIAAALALARQELPKLASGPRIPEGTSQQDSRRLSSSFWRGMHSALRILAVAGEETDARLLMTTVPGEDVDQVLDRATLVGYLENRLGVLERGQLTAALRGDNPAWARAAAIQLHDYGSSAGDGLLRAFIAAPANARAAFEAAHTLLDDANPQTLEAMRALLQATIQGDRSIISGSFNPAFTYILAYGTAEDWQKHSSLALGESQVHWLLYLADDVRPLVDMLAYLPASLARLAVVLRDFPPERADEAAEYFEDAILAHFTRGATVAADRVAGNQKLDEYRVSVSYCWPNLRTAELFFKASVSLGETPWIPALHRKDEILTALVNGTLGPGWEDHLDYVPHEQLVRDLDRLQARDKMPALDLFLSRHLLTSRAYLSHRDLYHDGVERRPYTLRDLDKEGAISGLLEVRPWVIERRLRVALRFQQAAYYHVAGLLNFKGKREDWEHHRYLVNGGKALIGALRLRRGEQTLPFVEQGLGHDGALLYEAELDRADLSGIYLDVELQFFDQTHHLVYDLFASDYARMLRQKGGQVP